MTYELDNTKPIDKLDYFRTISSCIDKLGITQPNSGSSSDTDTSCKQQAIKIEEFFASFGILICVCNVIVGSTYTRFEINLETGVSIKRIKALSRDLSMFMETSVIEIAPIPGKTVVGIDVLNKQPCSKDISKDLKNKQISYKPFSCIPLGIKAPHEIQFVNLNETPNLLITGLGGSGKTTCMTSIIQSSICRATPNELKLILLEGTPGSFDDFEGFPHLLFPVVKSRAETINVLSWITDECRRRLQLLYAEGVKNITEYNNKQSYFASDKDSILPLVIILIDDYDLIVEEQFSQINQFMVDLLSSSHKAGIHFIVSTNSPLSEVIGGTFKSRFNARATYKLSSSNQSVAIIEQGGAEKLFGKGEMLFRNERGEINHINSYMASDQFTLILSEELKRKNLVQICEEEISTTNSIDCKEDEFFDQVASFVIDYGSASVNAIQRHFDLSYPKAARLLDELEKEHIIGPFQGSSPRKILITKEEWYRRPPHL